MVHPFNGILVSNEKKQTTDTHNNLDEAQKYNAKLHRPVLKCYTMYNVIYLTFSERQYSDETSGCQRLGQGRKEDYQRLLEDCMKECF